VRARGVCVAELDSRQATFRDWLYSQASAQRFSRVFQRSRRHYRVEGGGAGGLVGEKGAVVGEPQLFDDQFGHAARGDDLVLGREVLLVAPIAFGTRIAVLATKRGQRLWVQLNRRNGFVDSDLPRSIDGRSDH